MSSAVQALLEGHTPATEGAAPIAAHGKRSRYRTWCACCAPEPEGAEGKPQRRAANRPVLAWRTRLAAQEALANGVDATIN